MLTTFVASCVGSSLEPMAQRARKILQEEGSHRVHGEAWAKRLCRGDEREAFVARLHETWEHAGRWIGPDDDAECAAALAAGEIKHGPAHQRELMRDLARGAGRRLGDLTDSRLRAGIPSGGAGDLPLLLVGRRRARRPVGRPDHHRPVALRACNSYFEAVREDFSDGGGEELVDDADQLGAVPRLRAERVDAGP